MGIGCPLIVFLCNWLEGLGARVKNFCLCNFCFVPSHMCVLCVWEEWRMSVRGSSGGQGSFMTTVCISNTVLPM